MGVATKIQWADHTFNPWRGCTKVSPGCAHCYAETQSKRNPAVLGEWGPDGRRAVAAESYWKLPLRWDREAREAGERRRVFCASLADVFEDRPELTLSRARLWGLIETTSNLDWLLLTKRPKDVLPLLRRIVRYNWPAMGGTYTADRWLADPLLASNVWLGVSVEDQERADERIPALLEIPAAVRFLSVEPLLGPIDLSRYLRWHPSRCPLRANCNWGGPSCPMCEFENRHVDWVIVGGESGRGARPCNIAWIRSIRDQCRAAGVACFVKQLGARPFDNDLHPPFRMGGYLTLRDPKGGDPSEWAEDLRVQEFPRVGEVAA